MDPASMKRSMSDTSAIAPPPKKANLAAAAAGLSATAASSSQPPLPTPATAHGAMTSATLQRQNVSLQTSLSQKKRELQDAATQLKSAQDTLAARDNTLSIFNRQWAQLEEQLTLLLAGLENKPADGAADVEDGGVLKLATLVAPLADGADVDADVAARCGRMLAFGRQFAAIAASGAAAGNGGAEGVLAAQLQQERQPLSDEVARARDRVSQLETSVGELTSRLHVANDALDKATKDLNPELAELREELTAAHQLAESRLGELQTLQVQAAQLRASEQEARLGPLPEEQLKAQPVYKQLQLQNQELHERAQVAEAKFIQQRNDSAQINTLRHSEYSRFEDYRMQQSQQASDDAKAHAAALSSALSERRSIELQLGQLALQHKREADRANDLDERLRVAAAERDRASTEIARLRSVVASKEAGVEAARAVEQEAREKAHALELEVSALKASASGEVPAEPAEKRWQDALIKLGSAELDAARAREELKAAKGAEEALMGEIEAVGQAYEELQAKNDELRTTLGLKEEALTRAKAEKLRADATSSMLRGEHTQLKELAEKAKAQGESLATLKQSYDAQLRKSQAETNKKNEELRSYEELLASMKHGHKEAKAQAASAQTIVRQAQEAEARAKEREEKASATAAAESAQVKRLSAERDALSRKLARASESAALKGGKGGGSTDAGNEILEAYRRKVKCSLCNLNDKDAIISKCMHAFCRECIQQRLDVRNRKCPACALQFDFQSVKDLFLTS